MGKADLHAHTTCSDGVLSPAEVVEQARQAGLAAVGITDHDSVDGVPEGLEAGRRLGIQVVPGVEINTDVPGSEVHVLGYFLNAEAPALQAELRRLRDGRLHRAERMVAQLQAIGVPVRLERVLEIAGGHAAIARPHVAQALIEMGAATDVQDAFARYLERGMPGYVSRMRFTPEQAIALVRDAGGVPVLAHPGLSGCDEKIHDWVRAGLRGLEVDHPAHGDEDVARYRRMARDLGLIATSGSDFHGPGVSGVSLGERTCGTEIVEKLARERSMGQ